jgi:hypothetical protein
MDQSLDLLGHDARRSLELAWLHPVVGRHHKLTPGDMRN